MKKLTLLLSAIMITGAAFAHDGKKDSGKKHGECSKKEAKAGGCSEKKGSCCHDKKATETAKK